jgi:hypothetical protein
VTDAQRLTLVRAVHSLIYLLMAVSTFAVLYAGATGQTGWWLWLAIGLLLLEGIALAANGMKCPLTSLAVRYGAEKGHAFDTFLPERVAGYLFRFFLVAMLVGLVLLGARWVGIIW